MSVARYPPINETPGTAFVPFPPINSPEPGGGVEVTFFNGTNQRVDFASPVVLSGDFDFSFKAHSPDWNPGGVLGAHFISDISGGGTGRFAYNHNSSAPVLSNDGAGAANFSSALPTGEIFSCVVQRVGNVAELWVDGASQGTDTVSGNITINAVAAIIGAGSALPALRGSLWDLQIDLGNNGTIDHYWPALKNDWTDVIGGNNGTVVGGAGTVIL